MDVKSFNSKAIDSNFEIVKIRDIIEKPPQYGANERAIDGNPNIDYRYIRITDIDDYGNLKEDERKTAEKIENKYIVNENDLLFARSGATAGKCYFVTKNIKGIFAGYMIRFILNHKKCISKYLFYITFTNFYKKRVEKISRAAAQPNINSQEYLDFEFPLPPLEIQQEIVDKMDSALAEKKNLENKSDEILNSIDDYVLSELGIELEKQEEKMYFSVDFEDVKSGRLDVSYFSSGSNFIDNGKSQFFELKPISEVANFIPGYAFSSKDYTKQGVKLCTIKNIKPYGLDFVDVTFLPEEYLDKYDKYKIKKGDIILAMTGATIGKLTKFEIEDNILLNQRVGIIRARDINQDFLYCFLNTDIFNKQIIRESVGGAQANISENAIMNIKIPVPKKEIQNKIANEVNSRIEKANELKKQANEIYEQAKNEVEKMILE